jgi:hypothetical protein
MEARKKPQGLFITRSNGYPMVKNRVIRGSWVNPTADR